VQFRWPDLKAFGKNAVPPPVFADVALQDNLDGEACFGRPQDGETPGESKRC